MNKESQIDIIKKLRFILENEHITQTELAKRIGIHRVQLNKYLTGKVSPTEKTINQILNRLNYRNATDVLMSVNKKSSKNVSKNNDVRKNGSGYKDPTASKAILKMEHDEKERLNKVLSAIFAVCECADFHVEGRIILKDMKTGRVWQ